MAPGHGDACKPEYSRDQPGAGDGIFLHLLSAVAARAGPGLRTGSVRTDQAPAGLRPAARGLTSARNGVRARDSAQALVGLVRPDQHAGDQGQVRPAVSSRRPRGSSPTKTGQPSPSPLHRSPIPERCSAPSAGSRSASVSSRSAGPHATASGSAAWSGSPGRAGQAARRRGPAGSRSSRSGTATVTGTPDTFTSRTPGALAPSRRAAGAPRHRSARTTFRPCCAQLSASDTTDSAAARGSPTGTTARAATSPSRTARRCGGIRRSAGP